MKKIALTAFVALFSMASAFAQDVRDLSLPGEKWVAKHTGYVCSTSTTATAIPTELDALKVKFERITTDSTLDNGLIKASFEENGVACRYNAIVFADNAASTMKLVESKAYSVVDGSECAVGKAVIDILLIENDYLYYGRPHNLAIMIPSASAEAICGAGAEFVGINFIVSGRI